MNEPEAVAEFNSGKAAAAIFSAGVGLVVFGVFVCLSESIPAVSKALTLYKPTGPLSGKVCAGVGAWLLSWLILDSAWKEKQKDLRAMLRITLALVSLGFLLTFPTIFDVISHK